MTQTPYGGASSPPAGARRADGDYGATTLSGNGRPPGSLGDPNIAAGSRQAASPSAGRGVSPARAAQRGPRRARLQLRHVSPMTVLKFSCVLAIALFFVWLIVVGVLYAVLDGAGVISRINDTVVTIQGTTSQPPVRASVVFEVAAIIGAVNIVLFVALATIGSVIYNLCADLVGGVEITLSER